MLLTQTQVPSMLVAAKTPLELDTLHKCAWFALLSHAMPCLGDQKSMTKQHTLALKSCTSYAHPSSA